MTNPCHFFNESRTLKGIVHGDDFLFTGTPTELGELRKAFEDRYECKVEVIGFGKGVSRSARFLNRVITYTEGGIEFEADQRLVEALVHDLNWREVTRARRQEQNRNQCRSLNTRRSWRGDWEVSEGETAQLPT